MSTTATSPATNRTESENALWAAMETNPERTATELAEIAGIGASTARKILARWSATGTVKRHHRTDPRAADRWIIFLGTEPEATDDTTEMDPVPAATEVADTPIDEPENTTDTTTTTIEPGDATAVDAESPMPATDITDRDDSAPATLAPVEVEPSLPTSEPTAEPAETEPDADGAGQPENADDDKPEKLAPGALRGQVDDYLRDHPDDEFSPHQIGKALDRSSGAVHNALVKLTDAGIATQTCAAPKKFRLAAK